MFESCLEIRRLFSEYVDAMSSHETRRDVRYHLQNCPACERELERYELLCSDLRTLPRPRLSSFSRLRLEVAVSQARHANALATMLVHLQDALRPLLLPASGAVLAGMFCLALTLNWLMVPSAARGEESSITPPRVESLVPVNIDTGDNGLWLLTHVNADGRVDDYEVVSGSQSPSDKPQLDRMMYFSVFHPATLRGRRTDAQLILSLRRITVRGTSGAARVEQVKTSASASGEKVRF